MKSYLYLKNLLAGKLVKRIILIIAGICIVSAIFQAGVFVGYAKAKFSRDFGNSYERNFGLEGGRFMKGQGRDGYMPSHGAIGKILTISFPTISVSGPDGVEKIISVGTSTLIKKHRDNVATSSLVVGDTIAVIGKPNGSGQIEAKLIRVMDNQEYPEGSRKMFSK